MEERACSQDKNLSASQWERSQRDESQKACNKFAPNPTSFHQLVAALVLGTGSGSEDCDYEPTPFTDVRSGMSIAEEEIFGPVLGILTFESEEEAVELANTTTAFVSLALLS